jgi:NAD(P)-dependent dehydrogenase (short-subunit alcohol dehydrogenase family)
MSKIALITVTKLYQQMANADQTKQGILFNSVCPGNCVTGMNNTGILTADQGNLFDICFLIEIFSFLIMFYFI